MIKVNKASFIATSAETQTSTKVSLLTVNYNAFLGTKEIEGVSTPQGYIQSFVYTETMNSIMNDVQEDTSFTGNILAELTDMYISKLQILNPSITFTSTL
tara:strand:+ start:696 stop:995 length:300 start_codon:yes stop_codon:yes gene_type:complete